MTLAETESRWILDVMRVAKSIRINLIEFREELFAKGMEFKEEILSSKNATER